MQTNSRSRWSTTQQRTGEQSDSPTRIATRSPVTRCSFTSWILGLSPGATALLMTVSALAWVTERTVAAASHGRPKRAQKPPMATINSKSRWKPDPFCNFRSFLLMISLGGRRGWGSDGGARLLSTRAPKAAGVKQEEEPPPQPAKTHVVICVSMKMRMKTSTAGSALATIIHTGKPSLLPRGLITQPRWLGEVTEKPLGTDSFWRGKGEKRAGREGLRKSNRGRRTCCCSSGAVQGTGKGY